VKFAWLSAEAAARRKERRMTWTQLSHGLQLDPIARGSPEALVVLLHDHGASPSLLTPVAARWATSVPTTAFIALDGTQQLHPYPPEHDASAAALLDRASRQLAPLLEQELRSRGLDAGRLVLVGFGHGATLALHAMLHHGAGVLAFATQPLRPLPRILRVDHKVRLIACVRDGDGDDGHGRLRNVVALLTARGIDARGVVLAGSALSDNAIRHGGAYLVELVASAQWHRVRNAQRRAEALLPSLPEQMP
jgi:predicted esterase